MSASACPAADDHKCPNWTLLISYRSRVVLFCNKHTLSLSVRAGGYGTGGWAVGGDIILDLSKLVEVDIETPQEDGSFTSLKDVAAANSKGKTSVGNYASGTGKRRREEDANLRQYDAASKSVAAFLHDPELSPSSDAGPPPNVKRRMDPSPAVPTPSTSVASGGKATFLSADSSSPSTSTDAMSSPSTILTSASSSPGPFIHEVASRDPPGSKPYSSSTTRSNADPFGYLDAPTNFPPVPPPRTVQSFYNPHALLNIWGSANPNPLLTDSSDVFAQMNMFSHIDPPYSHVYVTFGAGMRQKEIDTYTAKNPIEPSDGGPGIPYHVPL